MTVVIHFQIEIVNMFNIDNSTFRVNNIKKIYRNCRQKNVKTGGRGNAI